MLGWGKAWVGREVGIGEEGEEGDRERSYKAFA